MTSPRIRSSAILRSPEISRKSWTSQCAARDLQFRPQGRRLALEELKLDQSFVADCGTDKVNAPLCETVIDLAHSFGRYVVAVGIEKAADAMAPVSMG